VTRYAVVGNQRSGTSMLMRSLDEAGISAHRDRERDERAVRSGLAHNPTAIRSSYEALLGRAPTPGMISPLHYQMAVGEAVEALRSSLAVRSVTELDYDRLVDNPISEFGRLVSDGWPIDVEAASQVPTSTLRHHVE